MEMHRRVLAVAVLVLFVGGLSVCASADTAAQMAEQYKAADTLLWRSLASVVDVSQQPVVPDGADEIFLEIRDPVILGLGVALFLGQPGFGEPMPETIAAMLSGEVRTDVKEAMGMLRAPDVGESPEHPEALMGLLTAAGFAQRVVAQDPEKGVLCNAALWPGDPDGRTLVWEMYRPLEDTGALQRDLLDWLADLRRDADASRENLGDEVWDQVETAIERAETLIMWGPALVGGTPADYRQLYARVLTTHAGTGESVRVKTVALEYCWPAAVSTFLAARRQAVRTVCLSNIKQMGIGLLMYTQDHDFALPPADNWYAPVKAYIAHAPLFRCPADKTPDRGLSYFLNAQVAGKRIDEIKNPAEVILIAEGRAGTGGPERLVPRHDGGVNVGYCDGHARWLSLADAMDPKQWTPSNESAPGGTLGPG